MTHALQGLVGRMAFSGTFDPARDRAAAVGATFEIDADLHDGRRATLFGDLGDAHEASQVASALAKAAAELGLEAS